MKFATIIDGKVIAVTEQESQCREAPAEFSVEANWTWTSEAGFKAPPPQPPWAIMTLDGQYEVEAFAITNKHELPPGVNVEVIDETRTSVLTPDGWTQIQVGDWLMRCRPDADAATRSALGLTPGTCLRLPYDEAARRLT